MVKETQDITLKRLAQKASLVSISVMVANTMMKIVAGLLSGSVSVLSEGIQSISDVLISSAVFASMKLSSKPADSEHPYGYGKAEHIMCAIQMMFIIFVTTFVFYRSVQNFSNPRPFEHGLAIVALSYCVVANFFTMIYVNHIAKKTRSIALESEFFHLRSDATVTFGVLMGLFLVSITGWYWVDSLIAMLFVGPIIYTAVKKLKQVIHPLMDGALPEEEQTMIVKVLDLFPQVIGYYGLKSRRVGEIRYVEITLKIEDQLLFEEAFALSNQIEQEIETLLPDMDVNIRFEPSGTRV